MTPCAIQLGESAACGRTDEHTHCAMCGLPNSGDQGLCNYHLYGSDGSDAVGRVYCDLLHRNQPAPRLPLSERDSMPTTMTQEDAAGWA